MVDEFDQFYDKPNFSIDTKLLFLQEEPEVWANCIKSNGSCLHLHNLTRIEIYHQCKNRYLFLYSNRKDLMETELKHPLCIVLAEVLFWLSDLHGALELLLELDNSFSSVGISDAKLKRLIRIVKALNENFEDDESAAEQQTTDEETGAEVFHISEPKVCDNTPVICNDIDTLLTRWNLCKAEVGENLAVDMFARYACVTTNELESVFEVESSTWHRLVRKGFMENSIGGITQNSKIKSKSRIIKVLRNTNMCIDTVGQMLSSNCYLSYDESFIKAIHARLMDGENLETECNEYGVEICVMAIPAGLWLLFVSVPVKYYVVCLYVITGSYRRMGSHTFHYPQGEAEDLNDMIRVQYCKFREIPDLMAKYCNEARRLLNDPSIDVFMKVKNHRLFCLFFIILFCV